MREHRGSEKGRWAAVPAVDHGDDGRPGPVLFTIEVDRELFAIRRSWDGGTTYDWLTGPNEGYGFAMSGAADVSPEEHCEAIRGFLRQIDPVTGYIADD